MTHENRAQIEIHGRNFTPGMNNSGNEMSEHRKINNHPQRQLTNENVSRYDFNAVAALSKFFLEHSNLAELISMSPYVYKKSVK